jgi:iron(III) transport system ATP-binding protein
MLYFRAMSFLTIQHLDKIYKGEKILDQLSFSIDQGLKLGIAGETGAAKTTLLKIIAGLLQPDGGQVLLGGERVKGPEDQLLPGHPAIGYVSQHFELRNHYRVEEELEMSSNLNMQETAHIVSICKIEHLLKRKTTELSGGERQRIVLAKALVKKPSLLLLDEPFSNLDPFHKNQMKEVLRDLSAHFSLTIILVSHDGSDLLSWADDLLLLQKGKIIQRGSPTDLYYNPVNSYAAGLLGPYNCIDEADSDLLKQFFNKHVSVQFPIIVRPAQLAFKSQEKDAVLGIVQHSFFMGGYWLVQVLVLGKVICVQTADMPRSPGTAVWVSLIEPF